MLSISSSFSSDRSVEAMLHSVEFLCSVVVAFARLVHVLIGKVLMSLCSPTSAVQVISAAGLPPARVIKKVHPVGMAISAALVEGERQQQTGNRDQLLPPPVVVLPAFKGTGNKLAEEKKATAKATVRGRPPTLVIPPVVARAGVDPFGEAEGRETDVATEVEARGQGFCVASRRGVRHAMEDGYGVITDRTGGDSQLAFYGVYDGHGGRAAVDFVADKLGKNIFAALSTTVASRRQPESSRSSSQQEEEEEDDEQLQLDVMAAIRAGYLTTDSEFLSQGVRGGACAATALVKDGEVYVANVGDCRAVLGSRGGVATALTADQTPARQDERHRIESLGGYVSCGSGGVWRVQDSLAVSRAFGDADVKPWVTCEPEIRRVKLTSDCRFLVLASDGLWNKVSNQEAVDVVANNTNGVSMEACKELVAMARSRGSRDDITAMAVDLQPFLR